ncbi:MAG: hemerythrin domain-containing protein [Myxococcales bacterium]|nr:hemerythrin domain-containing protein [Myxococcales bacterium]
MTEVELITNYLIRDHHRLHDELQASVRDGEFDPVPFARFRAGLLRHIGLEEKLLFPAVKRIAGSLPDGALQLRIEHGALTSLLVPTPDPTLVMEIASLLEEHDALEESVVYAECETVLGEAMSRRLTREAERRASPPLVPHFDGPGVHRTAAAALAAAQGARRKR